MRDSSDPAIEAQDTVARNVIGVLAVFVLLAVFLFSFFSFFQATY